MTTDAPLSKTLLHCIQVLEMVHVLHGRGYERLRIEPGMSPSGMHWRCGITHAGNMDPENGALCAGGCGNQIVLYTSGMRDRFFDWDDGPDLSLDQMANRFLEQHHEICGPGLGDDPEYVAWYALMLSLARKGELPFAYDDDGDSDDEPPGWLPTMGESNGQLPWPPLPCCT